MRKQFLSMEPLEYLDPPKNGMWALLWLFSAPPSDVHPRVILDKGLSIWDEFVLLLFLLLLLLMLADCQRAHHISTFISRVQWERWEARFRPNEPNEEELDSPHVTFRHCLQAQKVIPQFRAIHSNRASEWDREMNEKENILHCTHTHRRTYVCDDHQGSFLETIMDGNTDWRQWIDRRVWMDGWM